MEDKKLTAQEWAYQNGVELSQEAFNDLKLELKKLASTVKKYEKVFKNEYMGTAADVLSEIKRAHNVLKSDIKYRRLAAKLEEEENE